MSNNVSIKFHPFKTNPAAGKLVYVVGSGAGALTIATGHTILASEWGAEEKAIKDGSTAERREILASIRADVDWETGLLRRLLKDKDVAEADLIKNFCQATSRHDGLFTFLRGHIKRLASLGHARLAEITDSALASLMRYCGYRDFSLRDLDSDFTLAYEAYLRGRGLCRNTTSYYLRALRSAYTRAVRMRLTPDRHPFDEAYTGVDITVKRALPIDDLRRLLRLDLRNNKPLEFARDMFMLSFYLQGMPFVDMAFLRRCDVHDGCVAYRRRKTGQLVQIAWTAEMQDICRRHPSGNDYLLPIIKTEDGTERRQYRNQMTYVNRNLKLVARLAGVQTTLSTYVSRHTWASTAQLLNVPISVISKGLGHESEKTTRIYLESIKRSAVDAANRSVINWVVNG